MHQLSVIPHLLEMILNNKIKKDKYSTQMKFNSTLVFIVSPQPTTPTHNVSHLGRTNQLAQYLFNTETQLAVVWHEMITTSSMAGQK